ncbi:MAG: general secretion pathway protein L [Cognaticolwellia sp.]|jgi:general secretion pathway protein L
MARVIGIDLGSHAVKLAVMEGRLGNTELVEVRAQSVPALLPVELPPPPVLEEGEEPPVALPPPPPPSPSLGARLATLAGMLEDLELDENTTFAVALPADKVSVRVLPMPFADRDRIAKTLPFELESYVPFELEDFVLDWRIHPMDEGAQVLTAMARQQMIGDLLEGLKGVGVDPKHLVLDADILGAFAPIQGTQVVLDLGHERSILCLVQNGEVRATRALSKGGLGLREGLMAKTGMDAMQAEAAKRNVSLAQDTGIPGPAAPELIEAEWDNEPDTDPFGQQKTATPNLALAQKHDVQLALIQSLDPLLAELRASLIGLEDELDVGIDEVLITGGGAGLSGLGSVLSQGLGVPVRRVDLGPAAEELGDPDRFGLAVVLAQKAGGITGGTALSFRKGPFEFKGDLAIARTALGVGMLALLMFGIFGTGIFLFKAVSLNSEIADLHQQAGENVHEAFSDVSMKELETDGEPRTVVTTRFVAAQLRMESLGATVGGEPPVLTTLKLLTQQSPKSTDAPLDISDLTITENTVSFKAETNSFDSVSRIEKAMQAQPRFSQAKKANETKAGNGIRFDMSIPLESESEEEEEG